MERIHRETSQASEAAKDRENAKALCKRLSEIGSRKLDSFDVAAARQAFDAALWDQADDEVKFKALMGILLIKAVTESEVIPLPGVPFEHAIMEKHFCSPCKTPTKRWRASAQTQYLGNAIVDCWYAECPQCKKTQKILFAVSRN